MTEYLFRGRQNFANQLELPLFVTATVVFVANNRATIITVFHSVGTRLEVDPATLTSFNHVLYLMKSKVPSKSIARPVPETSIIC